MRTVEDYIITIDAKSASIVRHLRSVILSCSNNIEESTINNSLSFYHNNFLLCSLIKTSVGIELFINYGEKITDSFKILSATKGNQYKILQIQTPKQVDDYKLIGIIQQTILLSELSQIEFGRALKNLSK